MSECIFLYHSGWRTNWVGQVIHNPGFVGGHPLRDPEVRAKASKTKMDLYGNKNFTNTEQAARTCMDRYGVDNVGRIKSVVDKRVQTCIERYGRVFNYTPKPFFLKDELYDLHVVQKLTLVEIGKRYSMTPEGIGYWMKKYSIPVIRRMVFPGMKNTKLSYKEEDIPIATELFILLSKERGVSRSSYLDGSLGVPTHVLEKRYGSWNNFVKSCGLELKYKAYIPSEHTKDYLKVCLHSSEVLSFYRYEKLTGKPRTRLKRLFNAGKPYHHLLDELRSVALRPILWDDFLKKLVYSPLK